MPALQHERLREVVAAICHRAGGAAGDAHIVADHLVQANLYGHDSHGVGMLPRYVEAIAAGMLDPSAHAELVKDDGAILVVDGRRGFGQVVAREAILQGIERARRTGVALVALRNAFHIGRIGTYGEICAEAGMISVHFVNVIGHRPLVAPFGGADARYPTNPFCCALPGADGRPPVVLDFATSIVAMGKVRVALNCGDALEEGLVIDHAGRPTTDPAAMFQEPTGALVGMGQHKGSGLALICELLAGVLTGGGTIRPETPRDGSVVNNMLTFIVEPSTLVTADWLRREIAAMVDYVKASPPADPAHPVLVAGEPERLTAEARRRAGILIDPVTWEQILVAGESVGIPRATLLTDTGLT
ncbi:MAG: malate/lactate/ureidoglycolate dehydrogenase [Alphaproteobacteria bacterium]